MKKIVSIVVAVTLLVTGLAVAATATVANAEIQQMDEFVWTAPNADGTIGEVLIIEYFLDEEQTTEFYEMELGISGITGQEAFIYEVTNVNWVPQVGVNGFSGFNIVNEFDVDTVGNAFGPPGWEAFAGYSGVNTPPNPANFEWDIRDSAGMGLMPGETGLFGFTVAANQYGDGHYGTGHWMHSWLNDNQEDITYQADISGPVPFVVIKEVLETSDEGDGDGILEVGEEWWWAIKITVTNNWDETIADVVLHDNLGGDLKLVGVWNGTDFEMVPEPTNKKQTWDGPYDLHVQWTGKTLKAHLTWDVGDLAPGEDAVFLIWVATDINTGTGNGKNPGHQEYTEAGIHYLNSGATATGIMDGLWLVIDKSNPLMVEAFEPN